MFDKTTLVLPGHAPVQHHHTHIEMVDPSVEKGARFLDEVQEKAASRITNAMLVDVPSIEAKLVTYNIEKSFDTCALEHRLAVTINGKNFDIRLTSGEDEDVVNSLVCKITDELLRQIKPSVSKLLTRKDI